jgi:EpsI family protein
MVMNSFKISSRTFLIAVSVLALTLVLTLLISTRGLPRVGETNLEKLPMEINGMQGVDDSFPESVYNVLNADKNVYRHYRSPDGRQVDLYIGYYGTAKGGRTAHNPIGCLPSQGWGLQESREIRLKCAYYPDGVPVNYLLSTKGDSSITTIYWYQSTGTKVLSNGIIQNIQRFKDKVFRNRNDGAFVRVTLLSDRDDAGTARAFAATFSERILDLLPSYWPVEK